MKISDASYREAEFACKNFHYSRKAPSSATYFNIFNEKCEWCGVIGFGQGSNNNSHKPFDMNIGEVLELLRVALNGKQKCTSQAIAMALKAIKKKKPQLKLVFSYSDVDEGHLGIIYQATNWLYLGKFLCRTNVIVFGKKMHTRSAVMRYGSASKAILKKIDENYKEIDTKGKHKYIMPLDRKTRKKFLSTALPYPKLEKQLN